jgi:non-heme chloroperoxidase
MHRRSLWKVAVASGVAALVASEPGRTASTRNERRMPANHFIRTRDGTKLFYRDWGAGPALLFVPPWALNSDWWEYQMSPLSDRGLRCVSYDRRGHGRSEEPARGYDFNTLADDLAEVIEQLDLRDVTLVGHSMGCGEVVRYLSRRPAGRVARAVLIATITPFTLKTADNPGGVDESELEKGRVALATDRPGQIAKAAQNFFGAPLNSVSPALLEWWTRMMLDRCSLKVMVELHRAFTRTDFRADLRKIEVPVLLIHGDRDVSTPIEFTSRRTAPLISRCDLKVYENAAHGLPITHMDRLNADLLAFAGR